MLKNYIWISLHDRIKMTESSIRTWPKNFHNDEPYFLNLTEIHDTDEHYLDAKKYAGAVSLDRSPSPGLHSLISPVASLLYKKKHQARKLGGPRM